MVRIEEELHVMLNKKGGNERFSENVREMLDEEIGERRRCWEER